MRKRTDEQHTNDKNKRSILFTMHNTTNFWGVFLLGNFFFLSGGILEDGRRDERRKGRDKRERKREGRRRRGLLLLWVTYNLLDASYRLGQGKQQEQEERDMVRLTDWTTTDSVMGMVCVCGLCAAWAWMVKRRGDRGPGYNWHADV